MFERRSAATEVTGGLFLKKLCPQESQQGTWRKKLITKYVFVGRHCTGIPFIVRDLTSSQTDQI